ncbi:MAG: MBL fold metallo-hydrolase [Desulfobacteraceae bacterium]|nr:MBL fold metallo-hydrolase [Desulfobacteraceae bacterium]
MKRWLFDKNKSQWTSWIIEGGTKKYILVEIPGIIINIKNMGENIHLGPENAVKAHKELKGKVLVPIHWGAYDLSIHPWKEPVEKVITTAIKNNVKLCLPTPGQLLTENKLVLKLKWWEAA